MSETRDLLIEIGTEELPPLALRRLAEAFRSGLDRLLTAHHLEHGPSHAWASGSYTHLLAHETGVEISSDVLCLK